MISGRSALRASVFTLVGLVLLIQFHSPALRLGSQYVLGDLGDWRFISATLEHLARAPLTESVAASDPPIFYPVQGALAYSDTLLLYVPPYALARAAGLSPHQSLSFTVIVLLLAGYSASTWMLSRYFHLPWWISVIGGALFSFACFRSSHVGHVQLLSALLLPLLFVLLLRIQSGLRDRRPRYSYGTLFAVSLAALFLTSFYVAWFFVFFMCLSLLCLCILHLRGERELGWGAVLSKENRGFLLFSIALFLVAMVPFLLLYLPAYSQAGMRPWAFVQQLLPLPRDLLNVGVGNIVWGELLSPVRVEGRYHEYEMQYGLPVGLLVLFLVTSWALLAKGQRICADPRMSTFFPLLRTLALAVLISWALLVSINGYSLWKVVFSLVPGAGAIRAPFRFQVVLYLAVVIVSMFGLWALWQWTRGRRARVTVVAAFCLLLVLEQMNRSPNVINAQTDWQRLTKVQLPPSQCHHFIMAPTTSKDRTWDSSSVDAMLIAIRNRIPTLNGYGGNFPPGWWGLHDPSSPEYLKVAVDWIARYNLLDGLCTLDLETGNWRRVIPSASAALSGSNLLEDAGESIGDRVRVLLKGIHAVEPKGRWTDGIAVISFPNPISAYRLHVSGGLHVNPVQGPLRILVNGRIVHEQHLGKAAFSIDVPVHEPVSEVQIDSPTFVPAIAWPGNGDHRTLGVFLDSVRLD